MSAKAGVAREARSRPDGTWSWQDDALCRSEPLVLFFGPDGERGHERDIRERKAKAICSECLAQPECLAYALSRPEKSGTWGGLNEEERATERRRRMRGEAAQALKAKQEKQAAAARAAEEKRAQKPWLFVPADPARDLELLRESDRLVADGVTMRDAAKELGVARTTLTDARVRAQKLLAGAS